MKTYSNSYFLLNQHIAYHEGSVVSKEIFKNDSGTITLFSFAAGQGLSEHKTPFDAFVYVIDGTAEITISGILQIVTEGEMIHMPANQPHALKANKQFKMLLTMMKK